MGSTIKRVLGTILTLGSTSLIVHTLWRSAYRVGYSRGYRHGYLDGVGDVMNKIGREATKSVQEFAPEGVGLN